MHVVSTNIESDSSLLSNWPWISRLAHRKRYWTSEFIKGTFATLVQTLINFLLSINDDYDLVPSDEY